MTRPLSSYVKVIRSEKREPLGRIEVKITDPVGDKIPAYAWSIFDNRGRKLGEGDIIGGANGRPDARKGMQYLISKLQDREYGGAFTFSSDVQAWERAVAPDLTFAGQEVAADLAGGGMGR